MSTATFATISALQMVFFSEAFVTFGRVIKIFSFNQFIFLILLHHSTNLKTLRQMWIIEAKYLIPKGFAGITLFPFIFLKEKKDALNFTMIQHEKIHIRQQIELLILPFYIWYLVEFLLRYLQFKNAYLAYKNISFEREAYANEKQNNFLQKRPFLNFIHYLKY